MKRTAINHTKLKRLMRALDVPQYAAVGILEMLWHLAARETPTGNIGKLSDEDIAADLDWRGDASALVNALLTAEWIDQDSQHRLIVHDWRDHCEDSVDMRVARAGLLYADGSPAKCTRLSKEEREKYLLAVRTKLHTEQENTTTGALPLPLAFSPSRKPNTAELSKESSRRPDVRLLQSFVYLWNQHCGPLPKVKALSKARQRKISSRISEGLTPERFTEAVKACATIGFLSGDNARGWTSTLDFLIANDSTIAKVLEGNYGEPGGSVRLDDSTGTF